MSNGAPATRPRWPRARQVVLADGAERGIRAIEFRTASGLAFDVLVDRGMDIGDAAEFEAGSAGR